MGKHHRHSGRRELPDPAAWKEGIIEVSDLMRNASLQCPHCRNKPVTDPDDVCALCALVWHLANAMKLYGLLIPPHGEAGRGQTHEPPPPPSPPPARHWWYTPSKN